MKKFVEKHILALCAVMLTLILTANSVLVKNMRENAVAKEIGEFEYVSDPMQSYERVPLPKEYLDSKFAQYRSERHEGDQRIVTLFTKKQFDLMIGLLTAVPVNEPLTLDEVIYIVNDTVEMYFEYDVIELTGIGAYNLTTGLTIDQRIKTKWNDGNLSHNEKLDIVARDIIFIVNYRLFLLDARTDIARHEPKLPGGEQDDYAMFTEKNFSSHYNYLSNELYYCTLDLTRSKMAERGSEKRVSEFLELENAYTFDDNSFETEDLDSISFSKPVLMSFRWRVELFDKETGRTVALFSYDTLKDLLTNKIKEL